MSCRYARIDSMGAGRLGDELTGVYAIEDVGRTKTIRLQPEGCLVQTWRREVRHPEVLGDYGPLTLHALRVAKIDDPSFHMNNAIAIVFWHSPHNSARQCFMVLDQLGSELFHPSRDTHQYQRSIKDIWSLVTPVLGSVVDSIITS